MSSCNLALALVAVMLLLLIACAVAPVVPRQHRAAARGGCVSCRD